MIKKIITEKELRLLIKEVIKETVKDEENLLCEMATIGLLKSNGNLYTLSVHGNPSKDRQASPHMHAIAKVKYQGKDNILFNLEFSLVDILTKKQLTILRVKIGNKVIVHSQTTDWTGYTQLKKDLLDYLFNGPVKFFGVDLINNLHLCIWQWNNEYDNTKVREGINVMRLFLENKGLTPLDEFKDYLKDL